MNFHGFQQQVKIEKLFVAIKLDFTHFYQTTWVCY